MADAGNRKRRRADHADAPASKLRRVGPWACNTAQDGIGAHDFNRSRGDGVPPGAVMVAIANAPDGTARGAPDGLVRVASGKTITIFCSRQEVFTVTWNAETQTLEFHPVDIDRRALLWGISGAAVASNGEKHVLVITDFAQKTLCAGRLHIASPPGNAVSFSRFAGTRFRPYVKDGDCKNAGAFYWPGAVAAEQTAWKTMADIQLHIGDSGRYRRIKNRHLQTIYNAQDPVTVMCATGFRGDMCVAATRGRKLFFFGDGLIKEIATLPGEAVDIVTTTNNGTNLALVAVAGPTMGMHGPTTVDLWEIALNVYGAQRAPRHVGSLRSSNVNNRPLLLAWVGTQLMAVGFHTWRITECFVRPGAVPVYQSHCAKWNSVHAWQPFARRKALTFLAAIQRCWRDGTHKFVLPEEMATKILRFLFMLRG